MPKIDSLYLHFPFCRHLCNYCDFYKTIPKDSSQDLINFERQLEDSFLTHQAFLEQNDFSWSELKTFYIGGGTPSLWGKQGAVFLSDWMKKRNLKLASDVEFTQEVNPGAWNNESLLAWQGAGVNRFSLGIQSYSQKFLEILDRFHDLEEAKRTLKKLSELKVNYSTDLMLGLPFSQRFKRDVITELKSILEFYPSHFSVYILTVKDHYKHFADLPSEEYVEEEYLKVSDFLNSQGFKHYEVSNYALKGHSSRHNRQYWEASSVAALGPSATGFLKFSADKAIRYKWKTSKADMETELLNGEQLAFEELYLALRTDKGILNSHFNEQERSLVSRWQDQGLANMDKNRLSLTSRGYLIMDSLFQDLLKVRS